MGWFAEALSTAMTDTGMSAGKLAKALDTSPSLIRKWKAGTATPNVERAAEIADALGVSYARLLLPPVADRRDDPDRAWREMVDDPTHPEWLPPDTGEQDGGAQRQARG